MKFSSLVSRLSWRFGFYFLYAPFPISVLDRWHLLHRCLFSVYLNVTGDREEIRMFTSGVMRHSYRGLLMVCWWMSVPPCVQSWGWWNHHHQWSGLWGRSSILADPQFWEWGRSYSICVDSTSMPPWLDMAPVVQIVVSYPLCGEDEGSDQLDSNNYQRFPVTKAILNQNDILLSKRNKAT